MASSQYAAFQQTMEPVIQELQIIFNTTDLPTWTGTNFSEFSLSFLLAIADVLNARHCHSLAFPPGINQTLYQTIAAAANWEFNFLWTDPTYGILR